MAEVGNKIENRRLSQKPLIPSNYAFSLCRDLRHSWEFERWNIRAGTGSRVLVCRTCPTRRREQWEDYRIVSRSYQYPKGYGLPGSKGHGQEILAEVHRRLARLAQAGKLEVRGRARSVA